jgi:hypothetical protein
VKVNFTPIQHPSDEVVNLNLRRIGDAFRSVAALLGGTAATPDAALTKVGQLIGSGTISGIPAAARSLHVVATGESLAGGALNVTVNSVAAGYFYESPPSSGLLGPAASWLTYTLSGGAAFSGSMDVTYGPGAAPTAFFRSAFNDAGGFQMESDGQVACASPISSISFVATAVNQITIDVWALL